MPAVFELFNAAGHLQVALGQSNFCMVQKGLSHTPALTTWPVITTVRPTVPYDAIAISGANISIVPKGIFPTTQPANTQHNFSSFNFTHPYDPCEWFAFRSYRALTPPAGVAARLELYNADTTLAFSSRLPKVLKGRKIAIGSNTPFNVAVPAGRKFAFLSYGTVMQFLGGGQSFIGNSASALHNVAQNRIEIKVDTWTASGVGPAPPSIFSGGIVAVDVTGY